MYLLNFVNNTMLKGLWNNMSYVTLYVNSITAKTTDDFYL